MEATLPVAGYLEQGWNTHLLLHVVRRLLDVHWGQLANNRACHDGSKPPLLAALLLSGLAEVAECTIGAILTALPVSECTRLTSAEPMVGRTHRWKLWRAQLRLPEHVPQAQHLPSVLLVHLRRYYSFWFLLIRGGFIPWKSWK